MGPNYDNYGYTTEEIDYIVAFVESADAGEYSGLFVFYDC